MGALTIVVVSLATSALLQIAVWLVSEYRAHAHRMRTDDRYRRHIEREVENWKRGRR